MHFLRFSILSSTILASIAGCGTTQSGGSPDSPDVVVAASTAPGGITVNLRSSAQLSTGLTPIFLEITDSAGKPVSDASVTFTPIMNMAGGKMHSAPVFGPPTLDTYGFYRCDVVFNMASTDVDTWDATVGITRPGAAAVEALFTNFTVTDSGRAKPFSWTDPATEVSTRYIASFNFVEKPRVGLNPVIVTLNRMESMMSFPPVDDATLALDPQMPSMGHGSPGSVAPTLVSSGRYAGQVSFSMTGPWETTLTVVVNGTTLGAPVFSTTF